MALPREDSKSERNEFEVVSRFRLRVTRGEDLRSFDHASKVNQLRNGVGGLEKEREREKKTIRSLAIVINNLEFVISGNGARGGGREGDGTAVGVRQRRNDRSFFIRITNEPLKNSPLK